MATPASCPLCGGSFPSKNAMFKHLRDENVETGGSCGSWCVKHGGVAEAARKIAAGELEEPTFSPPPPPPPRKAKASKKKASAQGTDPSGQTTRRDGESPGEDVSPAERVFVPEVPGLPHELWVGGIPASHASTRKVSQILYCAIPGNVGIAVPVVRHVVRRGWRESVRKGTGASRDGENTAGDGDPGDPGDPGDARAGDAAKKKPKGAWLGYAFVAFRDAEEAAQAMLHVDGKVVRETTDEGNPVTITLSARPATVKGMWRRKPKKADGDEARRKKQSDDDDDDEVRLDVRLAPGADPSRFAIARAWPRLVLSRRAEALGYHTVEAYLAAEKAASLEDDDGVDEGRSERTGTRKLPSPTYSRVRGVPIPPRLLDDLRVALEHTRWPIASHRRGVDAQKYLLVSSSPSAAAKAAALARESAEKGNPGDPTILDSRRGHSAGDPYGALKLAAFRVLHWADPRFQYDRLAVTKNFTGSPHVDKDDVTFQYAVSLGDFGDVGGELVVESEDGAFRWEVDTRDRVARVDGRFVHWVRGYDSSGCLLYTSPSPRDKRQSRMPSSA